MIQVTRLNGKKFWVNPHLIEFLEETPDTVVTLLTGKKVVVREKAREILEEIILYRRRLMDGGNEVVPIEIRGE
ncbi:MAG: flagellar FlbD family protein [Firmicutes bacterium]|jgi:flagellar protein FlbD|nr:flagellar FlbD family protein [Bacillota bacterium]